jgi:hypothetical protein
VFRFDYTAFRQNHGDDMITGGLPPSRLGFEPSTRRFAPFAAVISGLLFLRSAAFVALI